ncbi:MAG: phosphate regulon sensor histidine kinase PhoR [Gammaproteobacteria bacterium]|nr:phosphate regulon sensor histidine kinase PhoR [Gammaproteobacteria bacterium]
MQWSLQEWLIASGLLGIALLMGMLTGAWSLMLLMALAVWLLLQYSEIRALARWSRRPLSRPDNHLESWQLLSDRLYRTLRQARRRTALTLERFRSLREITNALPDAAVIIDHTGRIESFNHAAQERLKLKPSDRGANLTALVRQPEFVALIKGKRQDGIVEFASPFDDERRLEARRIRIDEQHALMLVRDVTQLNRLLTMRQDFVANVSHELRTPLTVVIGYLETMAGEDMDPETVRELLRKLDSPTARMRALVDDLLLLSRLEASPQPDDDELDLIDMCSVIRGCISEARVLSDGHHQFDSDCDKSVKLLGVESEIYSTAVNMVTNAVRYSPDGGCIRLTWQRQGDGARLAVSDQGMGIAPEHLQRITERFYRVDLAKARVRGGTGLGLAIVKHVLKRHRSALQVNSELGQGSTFFCDFPAGQIRISNNHQSNQQEAS